MIVVRQQLERAMPWKECSQMSSRLEFVLLALAPGANMTALSRAAGVSRKTGYKWRNQYLEHGVEGLTDRSRRPRSSPKRSSAELEARVVSLHKAYPCWGARKLQALLPEEFATTHPNTIAAILRRNGCGIVPNADVSEPANKRFEHEAPNLLWQMDFKGHIALTGRRSGRCHPLTVLDDHSRFAISLTACAGETGEQVRAALTLAFQMYGLPERMTCDNGPPWGTSGHGTLSRLEIWLLRLGIKVGHSRPFHPQTQGKDERFHRTLKRELLDRFGFNSIDACQSAFDGWRDQYNLIRPHAALGQKPPISRYAASGRPFPALLPAIEYDEGDDVRKVRRHGQLCFKGCDFFVGEGLTGEFVAVRPTNHDGIFTVVFCDREITRLDLTNR
jgi:transposase InsO family protein